MRLTGFRQQILDTPLYYESESSVGYYRRLFADTNMAESDFYSGRADTFHQITMPETFFNWLSVTAASRRPVYLLQHGHWAGRDDHERGPMGL